MKKYKFKLFKKYYIDCLINFKQIKHSFNNALHPNPLKLHKLSIRFTNSTKVIDIKNMFFRNDNWFHLFDPNFSFISMTWSFNNVRHKRIFSNPQDVTFPFYDITTLYTKQNFPNVISFCIDNNDSYTDSIKKYAGPFHDYYNEPIDLSQVLGFCPSSYSVLFSNGNILNYNSSIFQLKESLSKKI